MAKKIKGFFARTFSKAMAKQQLRTDIAAAEYKRIYTKKLEQI